MRVALVDVIDRLELKSRGFRTIYDEKSIIENVDTVHYYTRKPMKGDGVHATPYKHIKVALQGTYTDQIFRHNTVKWEPIGESAFGQIPPFRIPGVSLARSGELSLFPPDDLRASSRNRLLKRLSASSVELGQTLAEVTQTASLIASKGKKLISIAVDIKKGRWSNALKTLGVRKSYLRHNTVEKRWLEAQFAIRPLISDLNDYIVLLNSGIAHNNVYTIHAKGYARSRRLRNLSPDDSELILSDVDWQIWSTSTGVVDLMTLRALSEFGLSNPVSLLWELLPLSVFVDYIVNVGDLIEGFAAPFGITFITGSDSIRAKGTGTYLRKAVSTEYPKKYVMTYTGETVVDGFQRDPFYDYPYPTVELKLPSFIQTANLVAFLVSIFRSR